jgi:hypothetical protein
MKVLKTNYAPIGLLLAAALAVPTLGWASSTTTSSASDSISTSVGSLSDSLKNSSDSSSKKTEVAAGDYRVVEVVAVAERPGQLRLTLAAVQDDEQPRLYLYLPETTVTQAGVDTGQTLTALARPYGLAFAKAGAAQPFYLLMRDEWLQELPSHPIAS